MSCPYPEQAGPIVTPTVVYTSSDIAYVLQQVVPKSEPLIATCTAMIYTGR